MRYERMYMGSKHDFARRVLAVRNCRVRILADTLHAEGITEIRFPAKTSCQVFLREVIAGRYVRIPST